MTPQEHFAQAERYASSVLIEIQILAKAHDKAGADLSARMPLSQDTLEFSQMTLRAGELHLKIAQALRADPGIRAGE